MRGSRRSEEEIIGILKQAEKGLATAELCRQEGISEQTFYRWKAKYGGLDGGEPASYVAKQSAMSELHACRLVGVARSTKRYRACRKDRETELRQRIRSL